MATALPYGLRDIKVIPFTDQQLETLGTPVDLPNSQTFSFTEAEDFTELRGDDKLITSRGNGSHVEWELEAGGLSLESVKVMYGGVVTTSGTGATVVDTLRKKSLDARPFFRLEGQAISDSGGDVHCVVFRCRATDNLEGEFADGEFFITGASGTGFPSMSVSDDDVLYEFSQNATTTPIATS